MKKNCYGLLVALLMCASVGLSWQPLCGEPRGMAHKIQKIRRSDVHLRNVRKPVKSAPQKNARTIRLSVWDSIATQIAAEAGKEKHLKLISGLDEQSIATVNRIISRCQQVQKNQKVFANEQECQILLDMQSNFWDKITRTADGNFAWKQYILPVNHFESQIFYDEMHIDRLKTLNNIRNKDIIDAGAFVGDSALILSPHTNGKIFAFEPVSKTYALLQETIKINNLRNIISVNMGLGDKNEVSSICVRGSGSSFVFNESSVKASDIEGGIQVTTIDDFVAKKQPANWSDQGRHRRL